MRCGAIKAASEVQSLQNQLPYLKKPVEWFKEVRAYDKKREECMEQDTALLQLDYGGFTDSASKGVSVWSATVVVNGRQQEHCDLFFDQEGKQDKGLDQKVKKRWADGN